MIQLIQDEKDKSLYRAVNDRGEGMYGIRLPVGEAQGMITRGRRDRYILEYNWKTTDKYAALQHMDRLDLPYRVTDTLGNERGWLQAAPSGSITGELLFHLGRQTYLIYYFRDEDTGHIADLTFYRQSGTSEFSQLAAKVSGLSGQAVTISSANDLAAEVAVVATAYFLCAALQAA